MSIRGLSCIFPVPDIQKTAEYYTSKLGFRAVEYLQCAEPHICLYRDDSEIILLQGNKEVIPNRTLYGYGFDAYLYTEFQEQLEQEFAEKGKYQVDFSVPGYSTQLVRDILREIGFTAEIHKFSHNYYLIVKW